MGEQPREDEEEPLYSIPLDEQRPGKDDDEDQVIMLDHDKENGDDFILEKFKADNEHELDSLIAHPTKEELKRSIETEHSARMARLNKAASEICQDMGIKSQEEFNEKAAEAQSEKDELVTLQEQEKNYRLTPGQQDRMKELDEKLAKGQPGGIILSILDKRREIQQDRLQDIQSLNKDLRNSIEDI